MKIMFIIQGEGRGHMTQAIALEQMLNQAGHTVCAMVIGSCKRREIPAYFKQKTAAPIHPVESPNFFFDSQNKSIKLWKTFYRNFLKMPVFAREIGSINKLVKQHKPDAIINFYDILGGFYFLFSNPNTKRICVAHQYLASHPSFPFAKSSAWQKRIFLLNNFLTSMNSHKKLALSFDNLKSSQDNLSIVPPLLRGEIKNLETSSAGHILAYVVNKGYGDEILKWHEKNQKIKIHCFWDNHDQPDGWSPRKNITFHHLNDQKFLSYMAACSGYVSTAGFESICEAMYLGKPIMMVPVKGQYEQACNALDAERVGAGINAKKFKLGKLLSFITKHRNKKTDDFQHWVHEAETIHVKEIEAFVPEQHKRRITFLKEPLWKSIKRRLNPQSLFQHSELDYQ